MTEYEELARIPRNALKAKDEYPDSRARPPVDWAFVASVIGSSLGPQKHAVVDYSAEELDILEATSDVPHELEEPFLTTRIDSHGSSNSTFDWSSVTIHPGDGGGDDD